MSNKSDYPTYTFLSVAPAGAAAQPEDALSPALPDRIWSVPSEEVVSDAMQRAKAIHRGLEQGREADAREAALVLAKDVLGLLLLRCRTVETLHMRRRIQSVMHSLGAAGAFEGSYVLALLTTAKMADEAEAQTLAPIPAGRVKT